MISKKPVKGTKDILPYEAILRRTIQEKIINRFILNGFVEIQTPAIDSIDLLNSSQGGDNEKIMFKILKRGNKLNLDKVTSEADLVDLGLRFDLTLPLSRYYANNVNELPLPFKCFQIGNVWRGERPQRGRYRQFVQYDVDIIGDSTINAEINLIKTVNDALNDVGFSDLSVRVNNRILVNELIAKNELDSVANEILIILDKLDKISEEDAIKEVSKLDINVAAFKGLLADIANLESIQVHELNKFFTSNEVEQFIFMCTVLRNAGYNIIYDPTLIRGMGYYTGTIFEITDLALGLSIAGGGRYDNLISKLSSIDAPGCGFSIGFERIIQIILEKQYNLEIANKEAILVDDASVEEYAKIMNYIDTMQAKGISVSIITKKKNVKKQINDLKQLGYVKFINVSEFE